MHDKSDIDGRHVKVMLSLQQNVSIITTGVKEFTILISYKKQKKQNYILRIALLLMFFPNNLNLIRYRHNHTYYKGLEIKTKLPKMFPKQRLNLWQLKQAKK